MHCTDTDEEGIEDLIQASAQATVGLSMTNKALAKAVAESSYYGRDAENQIARAKSRGEITDRIENAQVLVGTPKTIIAQIKRIKDILGPGILDLSIGARGTAARLQVFGRSAVYGHPRRSHGRSPHRPIRRKNGFQTCRRPGT
jgi:alkanesulfonate monooxygenase SsuD/methylene tetrahydromethanopterin reductase-like flavin-dependent oxidoreductase (luciferase family)